MTFGVESVGHFLNRHGHLVILASTLAFFDAGLYSLAA